MTSPFSPPAATPAGESSRRPPFCFLTPWHLMQRDSKIGITVVYPFAPTQLVKVGYSIGSLNNSEENFDVFVLSYSRAF